MRLIVVTFMILGFGFYELSGGSEFEPAEWRNVKAPVVEVAPIDNAASLQITEVLETLTTPANPNATDIQEKPTPHYVLSSVPTTRRLAGATAPTPLAERAEMGPENTQEAIVTEANFVEILPIYVTTPEPDFRWVSGNRVNMRNGPGTQYSVVGKLLRNSEVEVLQDPGQGWVKLQALETGRVGWMSAKLLRKQNF